MIKRDLGTAQFHIDKIGQPVSNESGETGKKLLLGAFVLVYVVEGYVRIALDENHVDGNVHLLSPGQTLYIERDEEASPSSMAIQASDDKGAVGRDDVGQLLAPFCNINKFEVASLMLMPLPFLLYATRCNCSDHPDC